MRRRGLIIVSVLFTFYAVLCAVSGIFLAEFTLHLPRRPLRHQVQVAETLRREFQVSLQDVSIHARDGVELNAWYINPRHPNGASVILLHGVTDNREGIAGFSPMFLEQGYAVLLPDSRAHGESGGSVATYGVLERYDVQRWTMWLKRSSNGCVYLFGESMGAAIALQAIEVTSGICAVTVESPFATFREIAFDRMAEHTPFGTWFWRSAGRPVIEIALAYARLRYHIDLAQANPELALEHSKVPALLIAGTADRNIPMRHSAELMRTSGSHAALWIVKGADHGGAASVAGEEFRNRVLAWFHGHKHPG